MSIQAGRQREPERMSGICFCFALFFSFLKEWSTDGKYSPSPNDPLTVVNSSWTSGKKPKCLALRFCVRSKGYLYLLATLLAFWYGYKHSGYLKFLRKQTDQMLINRATYTNYICNHSPTSQKGNIEEREERGLEGANIAIFYRYALLLL